MTRPPLGALRPLPRLRFLLRCAALKCSTVLTQRTATAHLGLLGEAAAEAYLTSNGYRVLARRARVPMGEADLVCESPRTSDRGTAPIVIVEVKTRDAPDVDPATGVLPATAHQPPEAAVDHAKRAKLRSIAAHLARANRWSDRAVRIDVVAIDTRRGKVVAIRHYQGIG